MIFRANVDAFFVTFILIILGIVALSCFWPLVFMEGVTWSAALILTFSFFLTAVLLVWSAFSIKYVFCQEYLFVRGGPFRSRIPYKEITSVAPTKDIFTGFRILSSRDALEICYKTGIAGSVKLSPDRKREFISELQKR